MVLKRKTSVYGYMIPCNIISTFKIFFNMNKTCFCFCNTLYPHLSHVILQVSASKIFSKLRIVICRSTMGSKWTLGKWFLVPSPSRTKKEETVRRHSAYVTSNISPGQGAGDAFANDNHGSCMELSFQRYCLCDGPNNPCSVDFRGLC